MPLLVLLLVTPLALARRWWGGVADVLLALVAVAMLVGTLGEPSTRSVFEPGSFDLLQVLFRLATVTATLALVAGAAADLRTHIAEHRG